MTDNTPHNPDPESPVPFLFLKESFLGEVGLDRLDEEATDSALHYASLELSSRVAGRLFPALCHEQAEDFWTLIEHGDAALTDKWLREQFSAYPVVAAEEARALIADIGARVKIEDAIGDQPSTIEAEFERLDEIRASQGHDGELAG